MKDTPVRKGFGFSIPSLSGGAQRLLTALQDAPIATPVIARLSPTLVADFETQVALVTQHETDQGGAMGTVNARTHSQAEAARAYRHLAGFARRCAALAFPGQRPLLRSEFSVGIRGPRDLPAVLSRARQLVVAVQAHAADLAPSGWTVADATALAAATDALAATADAADTAADVKQGVTAQLNGGANGLYKLCRRVQNAADFVYPAAQASSDPTIVATRARFLLGEFPRRWRARSQSPPAPSASVPSESLVPVAPPAGTSVA